MRLLHTADWHLGRTFHGIDLLSEQEAVLDHIAELVTAEHVDVVLVAGDIYDRAVPSAEAVRVGARVLERIARAGAAIVLTSGNHDSAARLGAFAEFAAAGGLHLRTTIDRLAEPVELTDEHGPIAIYGVPYLEPDPARAVLGTEERGHTAVLGEAMRRIGEDHAARGQPRSVVLAHAFVTGGEASGSERSIAVGGAEQVPAAVFDGADYVALGHLHGPQRVTDRVRYAGSPLAYSFAERAHHKSVWLIDLPASGAIEAHRRELPVPRGLATASGTLEALLTDPAHAGLEACYLSVTLTDPERPIDPMRKLRERFPHAVHLEWQPEGGHDRPQHYAEAVRGRSDSQIMRSFLRDCRGREPAATETELLREAREWAGKPDAAGEAAHTAGPGSGAGTAASVREAR